MGTARQAPPPGAPQHPSRPRSNITGRAIALAVVLLVLVISYANSLRIYLAQSENIDATRAQITERQERISDLQAGLALWDDPAYVKIQARERLGWVVPGETGYKVIGADGKPLGGGAEISVPEPAAKAPQPAWWTRLVGSVEAADRPTPVAKPTKKKVKPPVVTVSTKPRPARTGAPTAPR